MRAYFTPYGRSDSLRPAAARWARAYRVFLLGDPPDPRRDDPLTTTVLDYQRVLGGTARPAACPAPRFRPLHRAHRVPAENGETRWELEARLLAGEPDRDIAGRVGLPPRLVALYHDVFCTCRDRLAASDWVMATFVGAGPTVGFAAGDLGGVWRWVGFVRGSRSLDVLIAATSQQPRSHAYSEAEVEAARRFAMAAQIPATTRPGALAALYGLARETERRAAPREAPLDPVLAAALSLMTGVGPRRPPRARRAPRLGTLHSRGATG